MTAPGPLPPPPGPRPGGRFIRTITVLPPAPAQIPTSSQTRRASARPLPPLRPLPEAAPAAGRQHPLSRTSAVAAPAATCSSSRAAGDPYRTAFAAISLTAITKSSARPAAPSPAHWPQVISTEPHHARHGETCRSGPPG